MHEIKNTCQVFGPKRVTFGNQGHNILSLSSGQTTTYWKTKGIQSYLRTWGNCDPIESGPSEPKNLGTSPSRILQAALITSSPRRDSRNLSPGKLHLLLCSLYAVTSLRGGSNNEIIRSGEISRSKHRNQLEASFDLSTRLHITK